MLVLKNCRLIPELTEGFAGATADIVIDGKYIKEILPAGESDFGDAETMDMGGKTVLPGFFDLHCHLMFANQDYNALMLRSQNRYFIDCAAYAKHYLKMGYTTVRDCGNDYYTGVAVRDAINEGVLTGARVITSGKIITPTTKGNASFGPLYTEIDDPAQMMAACRREIAQGCDFIKYMITGAVLNEGGEPGEMVTTPEEIAAICKAADKLGTYVAAHCHGTEGIKEAIKNGIHTIEHASYMDEECVNLILERGNTVSIIPTLSVAYTLSESLFEGGVLEEFVVKAKDAVTHMALSAKMAEAAGICVGFGTDLDMSLAKQLPGLEFYSRVNYGVDNLSVLKQATINSAKIVHMEDVLGTVKAGKWADLVVIDGNPDEDMNVMKNLPTHVFKEGKIFVE